MIVFNVEVSAVCGTNEGRYIQGAVSLYGYAFNTLSVPSLLSCSLHCFKDSRCVSTNFKLPRQEEKGVCELNDASLFDGNENHLEPEEDVVFSQYAKVQVRRKINNFRTDDKNCSPELHAAATDIKVPVFH